MSDLNAVPHRYSLVIREGHLDSFGHVNNAEYLRLLEEARWEFITDRGYRFQRIQETGLAPVILDIHLKFKQELRLRQKIWIETTFLSVQRKLARMQQVIRSEEGQVCCTADLIFGIFDLKQRKLVTPDAEWRKAIGGVDSSPEGEKSFS